VINQLPWGCDVSSTVLSSVQTVQSSGQRLQAWKACQTLFQRLGITRYRSPQAAAANLERRHRLPTPSGGATSGPTPHACWC